MRYILFLLIAVICVGCDTPYSTDFLGNGVSVDDIVGEIDSHVAPGECVTDGFDWLCRGETHVVTLEVIREVEVPVEVEVIREVEVPIEIKELYAVLIKPNETIQTPVGVIQTDGTGAVVSAPEGVRLTSVTVPSGGGGTPQQPNIAEKPTNPTPQTTPQPPVSNPTPQNGGYIVFSHLVDGRMQSGVIHSDYVVIQDGTITFTGSDGEVDGDDNESTLDYVKVETGYTYEQASDRAPEILSE